MNFATNTKVFTFNKKGKNTANLLISRVLQITITGLKIFEFILMISVHC